MPAKNATRSERRRCFDPDVIAELVRQSRHDQQLPPHICSSAVLARLSVLVNTVLVRP